jgi:organic radical activating enzyme
MVEVFASGQGEGAYVGQLQVFLRLAICPLRCLYCDTERSWRATSSYRVFENGSLREERNPVSPQKALAEIAAAERGFRSGLPVSLTGGEPLVHAEFLASLVRLLHAEGRRVHLETAGAHPEKFEPIASLFDHVSMDWKAPSTMERGDFRDRHRRFLALAAPCDLAVKFVLTPAVPEEELVEAVESVAERAPDALFVLQPVTPARMVRRRPSPQRIRRFAEIAFGRLSRVRVLPQIHPILRLP